ncbi:MAG: hypothetical protein ACD_12C00582G0002 [uncultured bacterium]|nr:MAG: hypothetical protein ACD_12C00582G0002 [uncultured bacterium]
MKTKNGFTLIEILVVTTIIVLLTATAVVTYTSFLKQSRDAKRKADLEQIRAALEMYRSNNDAYYPGTMTGDCPNSVYDIYTAPVKYIENMPFDPKSGSGYYYRCNISTGDYTLGAYLESGSGSCLGTCKTGVQCNYCVGPYGQTYP